MPLAESLLRFGMSSVKSDNFRSKRPENPSRRPFSAVSGWNVGASQGPSADEGGLSNGAGISGGFIVTNRLNLRTSFGLGASLEEIYREGKSLSLKLIN
jgi:hypothetical protein